MNRHDAMNAKKTKMNAKKFLIFILNFIFWRHGVLAVHSEFRD